MLIFRRSIYAFNLKLKLLEKIEQESAANHDLELAILHAVEVDG